MYLTRFRINTARTDARRLLGSPHRLHGAVNMAFPEPLARDGAGPRVLWRLDQAPGGRADLLISSPGRPDLTHLAEQAGWPTLGQEGWTTFAYGEFLDSLAEGDVWAFRLTANPVHHIRREQDPVGAPTKRAAHVTVRHQLDWLLKQQERAGFTVLRRSVPATPATVDTMEAAPEADTPLPSPVDDERTTTAPVLAGEPEEWEYQVVVHDRTPVRFGKAPGRTSRSSAVSGRDVRFARATFDGRLQITDLAAFRRTLTHGLGKAKAYGCGLMTLAPVR
ncbi:type I-E CRISPR-associated protein Cas6/Cse3/CasE [Streptomyces sp. LaPpAH-108]|uniref:type I-E CRISPR-associated protein Cas6/Cse3/CasE n=1 Tax=Streptomyces sp. LaPpAH-108 TaxID=1155714 RepID=UPI0003A6D31E|nr:type I-E CRISPR-associated protein Cas6/Cse3/CasE [Streptomyces sp. LaPpAH-108]